MPAPSVAGIFLVRIRWHLPLKGAKLLIFCSFWSLISLPQLGVFYDIYGPRTTEREMSFAVSEICAGREDGYATLPELREEIPNRISLTPGDLQPSPTRPGERMWEQILRNIRSHHDRSTNFICLGYLEYIRGGAFRITDEGREMLRRYERL